MKKIALVGTPNSGKSTLFNWLTGSQQKVVNYPGSTVDYSIGKTLPVYGADPLQVVDTPGTYSFFAQSQDEEVTVKAIYDPALELDGIVLVVDACQVSRQLHLYKQLKETGYNFIIALTMVDLVESIGGIEPKKMSSMLGVPVIPIHGLLGGGVKELYEAMKHLATSREAIKKIEPWSADKKKNIYAETNQLAHLFEGLIPPAVSNTQKIDRWLLHPVLGLFIFTTVMITLFSSIYFLATPFMDFVDGFFGQAIEFAKINLPEGLINDFISDGLLAGIGAVLVFVPQIFILFLGISFLEDSGYLARAATLIDQPLSKIGLNGKSFVPLLSGFACAIPAMMAARTINSKKAKLLTVFVIPLMTCSARLPVYALLLGFLFAGQSALYAGAALALLYLAGLFIAALISGILSRFMTISEKSFFMLELPLYRRPQLKTVVRNSYKRTKSYIVRSGPIIFLFALLIWVGSTFPNYKSPDFEKMSTSYIAQLGQVIEPVFEPMGGDWRVGVGLISAFAAREVFVSTLAIILNVSEEALADDEESLNQNILTNMRMAKKTNGEDLFNFASVIALLVFFVVALQCTTTTAVAYKEMQSKRFAILQLISMNLMAYFLAVLTYQVLS